MAQGAGEQRANEVGSADTLLEPISKGKKVKKKGIGDNFSLGGCRIRGSRRHHV